MGDQDGADRLEALLDGLGEADDIPDDVLNEFVNETQDFFDSYVTPRLEMQTLQELEQSEVPDTETTRAYRRRPLGERLPDEIAPLIRAANDEYIHGNFMRATNLAKDAISQFPQAAEPYSILALIAEDSDSPEVSLTFLVKAAERSTDSAELWSECARLAEKLGKLSAAVGYLKKAAQFNRDDTTILLELYDLLNGKVVDNRTLVWTLSELTKRDPINSKYASELATYQYNCGQCLEALDTLQNSVDAQFEAGVEVDMGNANLLANGYLNELMNEKVIEFDSKFTDAPPDFRANAGIAFIRRRELENARTWLQPLSEQRPSVFEDAFSAVAEEYLRANLFTQAIEWLTALNDDGLEHREDIAHCLALAGRVDEALLVLQDVIVSLPALVTPPVTYYRLMKDAGRTQEAVLWLQNHSANGAQSDEMVLKRATIALDGDDISGFLDLATPLLSRVLYDVYKLKLLTCDSKVLERILGLTAPERMNQFMMKILRYRRFSEELFPTGERPLLRMAASCLSWLFSLHRLEEALVLGGLLVICREKLERRQLMDVLFQFSLVAFQVGDGASACGVMRAVLLENEDNAVVWEFFNVFLQKTPEEEGNAHKFMLRSLSKLPDCVPLQIMLGNHSQSTVWFDHSITQYLNVLRDQPGEPLVSLLLAAAYLSKAMVRTQKGPRKAVLCSYACMRKYSENRVGDFPAEVNYNMGKFYQALKMFPHAERMYRKVLDGRVDYEALVADENRDAHFDRYDMRRDAAFNLSLMLRESNPLEARRLIRKYLTV
jgi:tetratricopeptide (TPR) repeat protein